MPRPPPSARAMLAPSAITIVRRRKPDRGLEIMSPPSCVRKLLRKGVFKQFD